jgi:hypothetical protein
MNTLITQGSKDTRTLKIDDTELGEVTAEEPGDNLALRARNDRSIEKDSISGDETLKKDHSDL